MLNPSWLNEDDDNLNRFNSIDLYATDEDDFDGVETYTSKTSSDDQED
jgi:hypothetical protein